MRTFKLIGHVDEQRRLRAEVPQAIAPGEVEIVVIARDGEDDAGESWSAGIAREWEAELSDPRQDIYTLNDGAPVDGPR